MIGINDFEEFDGVYCLCGYYVDEQKVNAVLQDVLAEDFHLPIKIETRGHPLRRSAGVLYQRDRIYDIHDLAMQVLVDMEMGTVLQAVGRVRPFTKPREVVLFQCGAIPGVSYHEEFSSLATARQFFDITASREKRKVMTFDQVQKCRAQGWTQKKTADFLKLSLRTIKRHWK